MKRTLTVFALVLVIAVSIVAGTLAMYTTTIDNLASGSVIAKQFIFMEDGNDSFVQNVNIAPTESQTWSFAVKNNSTSGSVTTVSETGMNVSIKIEIGNISDTVTAIAPLVVTVKDSNNNDVATQTGAGTITFNAGSFAANTAGSKSYTVVVTWPSNNAVDINYAGHNHGTAVKVSATATQA